MDRPGDRARRHHGGGLQHPRAHDERSSSSSPSNSRIAWVAGYALRERGEQVEAAEIRAARAEQRARGSGTRRGGRGAARIARELHDIVAHAMSVMVLQVGAVRHKLPQALEEDREALGRVERAGRTALMEMRRLLGAMRRDGDGLDLAPQPGLDGLDSLLEDVGRAGLPAAAARRRRSLRASARDRPLGVPNRPGGLTNSLKHANATRADVTVRYRRRRAAASKSSTTARGVATSDGARPRARRHP